MHVPLVGYTDYRAFFGTPFIQSHALVELEDTPQFWGWFFRGSFFFPYCNTDKVVDRVLARGLYAYYSRPGITRFSCFVDELSVYIAWRATR